ncbi:Hypothetical predicted protein [Paramuricea clavata]|uniref:Uncharacterized protein n=1 Tax=Paramuricea clavata TaxID=317549 RepID=A0A6S7GBN4_PARCT|nr:Hypothetical predicted protein [Paramuricea clavata]
MVKIEELNRKRSSAKKKFDDEVKSFEFVLEARPEIHSLEEAFGEVKVKYKAVREIHDGITDLMVEADIEEADFTNHDIFITEIIAKYGDLLSKLEQYRRKCEVDQTSKGLLVQSQTLFSPHGAAEKEGPEEFACACVNLSNQNGCD